MRSLGSLSLLLLLLLMAGSGCTRIYLPGGFDMTPTATMPASIVEPEQTVAIAANYSGGYNYNESNTSTELSYTFGDGGGWYRFAAKGFLYAGSYRIDGTYRDISGSQAYFGIGGLGDANVAIPMGKVTLGIGATLGGMTEVGPYTRLYIDSGEVRAWPLVTGYWLLTITPNKDSQIDLQAGVGIPGALYGTASYFYDRWGGTIGFGPGDDNDHGTVPAIGRFTLGLSYRVK